MRFHENRINQGRKKKELSKRKKITYKRITPRKTAYEHVMCLYDSYRS